MNVSATSTDLTARGLAHEHDLAVGAMTFRPSLCRAEIRGEALRLEPRVALVLLALARAEGSVLSRDDLISLCWAGVVVGDDAISRVIGKIRRVAERPGSGFVIETVPRIGYRLVATGEPAPVPKGAQKNGVAAPAPLPTDASSGQRVAVLRFDGEGSADAHSHADGATDCILSRLARESGVAVVGRPDSFQFRGEQKGDAARALGATQLVDGAVSVCGDEVRITAYLIDGAGGMTLWSEQFRGTTAELFALQQLSAVKVAEALRRVQPL